MSAGVTAIGSGAAARMGDAKAPMAAIPDALRSLRLEMLLSGIAILSVADVPRETRPLFRIKHASILV
jgi:hypothetical protein